MIIGYNVRTEKKDIMHLLLVAKLLREGYKISPYKVLRVAHNGRRRRPLQKTDRQVDIIQEIQINPTILFPPLDD